MNDFTPKVSKKRLNFNVKEALNKSSWKKFKPKSEDYFARDTKLEGFFIKIYQSGTKSYGCRARLGGVGKPKTNMLGRCDVTDFNLAKDKAKELIHSVKYEGINPKAKIRAESLKQKSLVDLAEEYIGNRYPKNMTDSTVYDYRSRMPNRLGSLSKVSVTEIAVEDVESWWSQSPKTRSDQVAFICARKLFSQALAKDYVQSNAFEIAKELIGEFETPEARTERHVGRYDMEAFFQAFKEVSSHIPVTMRDYLVFLMLTGKRKGESQALKWSNVKWEKGIVIIEKQDTKTKKVDVIPMTDLLYFLLRSRYEARGETQGTRKHRKWVFQSRAGDGHIVNPYKAFNKVAVEMEEELGFLIRPHDLRRTLSTATKELGIPKEDLAVLLNHSKADVTDSYVYTGIEYKKSKLKQVEGYLNEHGNQMLSWMAVNWYGMNSIYFEPYAVETKEDKGMSLSTRMKLKSVKFEKDFDGFGHEQWKPSQRLLDAGWIHDEDFFKT